MPDYVLGIDVGGTVAKAGLFTATGEEVAVAARRTQMRTPQPGYTERDMDNLWTAAAESISNVLRTSKIPPAEIACIAPTGHGNGLYLVDDAGRPVRPGIVSPDTRAQGYVSRWYDEGVVDRVRQKTMQSVWPGQPVALLAWLLDHEPEVVQQARWVLMCKDYLRYRLTGRFVSDLTDMSGTSLMDVGRGEYDAEVLEAFGLSSIADRLPPAHLSESICGEVTAQAAAETGLAEGTPVAAGMFDIDACALACGLVDDSPLCIIAGTWSINQYIAGAPVIGPDVFMSSRYCIPGFYLIPEASATSASNLEWFLQKVLFIEDARGGSPAEIDYDHISRLVEGVRPEDGNVLFLPFIHGAGDAPEAGATFAGMGNWNDRSHLLRAVFEGVVFEHRRHVDRLLRFRDAPSVVRLAGGAARSRVWAQIFADVLDLPVEVPEGTELGTQGAAICAAVAAGMHDSYPAAVEAMVRLRPVASPEARNVELYRARYERYQKLIQALAPIWETRSS